jgi:two-component system heavy metal sensor histidine kinase CusS
MSGRSIRFRLTVWYAAVLTAGLAVFGGSIWWLMQHRLLAEMDDDLAGRAARFEGYFRAESLESSSDAQLRDELNEFCMALPSDSYIAVRGASGFRFRYPETPNSGTPATTTGLRMIDRRFVSGGEEFDMEVGAPSASVEHTLGLLRTLLASLIPVMVLIACIGGAWLSGRALKPVRDLSAAAMRISIDNLSERLPEAHTRDELAELTQVLNSMLARLESAVATLAQFAADASHELRTPLSVIRTSAELALRRERTAESYRDTLREVAGEAARMTQLVEDLLILARNDAALAPTASMPPFTAVDARDVIRDVGLELHWLAEARGVRIRSTLPAEPALVSGHRHALHRLFLALMDNAVKYSPRDSEVLASVECTESGVSVAIQDSGPGISPQDLPHIFQRFYRANRVRGDVREGAQGDGGHGLGLSLAQSIARTHGGKIAVESREGGGSTFRVQFARLSAIQQPEPETQTTPQPSGRA